MQSRTQELAGREASLGAWQEQCRAEALRGADARAADLEAQEAQIHEAQLRLQQQEATAKVSWHELLLLSLQSNMRQACQACKALSRA